MHKKVKSKVCKPNDNGMFSDLLQFVYANESIPVPTGLDNSLHSRTVTVVFHHLRFSERSVQVQKCYLYPLPFILSKDLSSPQLHLPQHMATMEDDTDQGLTFILNYIKMLSA